MDAPADLVTQPQSWLLPAIVLVALLLAAVIGLSLWWLARRVRPAGDPQDPGEEAEPEEGPLTALTRSRLRRNLKTLAAMTGRGGSVYQVPWVVVAGIQQAGALAMVEGIEPDDTVGIGSLPRAGSVRFYRGGAVFHAGDDLLSEPGELRRWRRMIRLMRLCRIHRPVDGLVVALPAAILDGPQALPPDRLADTGSGLHEVVASVQRITGLRVPVTVAITACETLNGFAATVGDLPGDLRARALGWAMPYSLETAFQADWADEAMHSTASALSILGVQMLMSESPPADPDGVMLLPSRVRAMAPRLRLVLAAMFRRSAYQEAFPFRGVYLTGAVHDGVAFAAGLFNDKVFREHRLARPVQGILTARNRRQRMAQAALAALLAIEAAALGWLALDAPRRADHLRPLLATIEDDLRQMERGKADPGFAQAASMRLLQEMVRLNVQTLTTPLAPSSYLSHADEAIEEAMAVGYDIIIIDEIGRSLGRKLPPLLAPDSLGGSDTEPGHAIRQAVARIKEFEDVYRTYEDLPRRKKAADLAMLAGYALAIELPPSFQANAHLYEEALGLASTHPIPGLSPAIEHGLKRLFTAAYHARFDERKLRQRLERIAQLIDGGGGERNPAAAHARLTELRTLLRSVSADLDSGGYGWINGSGAELGPDFDHALAAVQGLTLTSPGTAADLRALGAARLVEARRRVFSLAAAGNAPLLRIEDGRALLSPEILALGQRIEELMAASFMSEAMPSAPPLASGSRPVLWDPQWLKTAQRLIDDYLAAADTLSATLPPDLAFTAELAAFDQLNLRVAAALGAAARPAERVLSAPYTVEAEMRAMASAGPLLAGLAEQMRRAGMEGTLGQLEGSVQAQARRLLTEIDAMAAGSILTAGPPDFAWWDGTMPVAARAYRVKDKAELAMALEAGRESLSRIAQDYADPLLRVLAAIPGGGREMAAKWQDIARALGRYPQKERDSSLRRLEQFILVDMDATDPAACASLAAGPATPGGDVFARHLDALKASMARRCAELEQDGVRRTYARIQSRFNETLAGRFPFSADARPAAPRADPAQVRRLFWEFPAGAAPPRALVEAAAGRPAADFLDALEGARRMLAPMLVDPTLDQPLAYEVEAEFRTNPAQDSGGNQIIEWTLDLGGDQILSSRDGRRTGTWVAGQPVRLSVRMARNAPSAPAPSPAGQYAVDGPVATWEAADPWALLSLMRRLAPEPRRLLELTDRRPHVLRLALDLRRNPDAAAGPRPPLEAELFLRLGISAIVKVPGKPEEKIPLHLSPFPAAAPRTNLPIGE